MSLADQIRDLAQRVQADLRASHDYFEHSIFTWQYMTLAIYRGEQIYVKNKDTGSEAYGPELHSLAEGYLTGYLAESVFQLYVSLFEDFVFGLIGAWLLAHPKGITSGAANEDKTVPLDVIFECADREAIIRVVVDRELDKLKYRRLALWFDYLNKRVKLGLPSKDQIQRLAEIKASRDILTHNRGIVNETYYDKAGDKARYAVGERLQIPESYRRESWRLIVQVVQDITNAALAKT